MVQNHLPHDHGQTIRAGPRISIHIDPEVACKNRLSVAE